MTEKHQITYRPQKPHDPRWRCPDSPIPVDYTTTPEYKERVDMENARYDRRMAKDASLGWLIVIIIAFCVLASTGGRG